MSQMYVSLPYDPSGTNPDNHVGSEKRLVELYGTMPYGMVTLINGGFYAKGLRVYDQSYNPLTPRVDYIITYEHKQLSDKLGLTVASGIVMLKPEYTNQFIYVSAQMVGGDAAFSFSVIADYVAFYQTKPAGYVPTWLDYVGQEPIWGPGELAERRWGLDMFQPYNMELENINQAITAGPPELESEYRQNVRDDFEAFKAKFTDTLYNHVNDFNNPHVDQPRHVDLGNVVNHPLATAAIARQATSDAHYLTPQLSFFTIETNADVPLNAHLAKINQDPHFLTPAKVNAYSSAETVAQIANKYQLSDQVANARNLMLNGVKTSYIDFVNSARQNLPASLLNLGIVPPQRLAFGTPTYDTLLRGNRQWTTWASLVQEYSPVPSASFYRLGGTYNDPNVLLQTVRNVYADSVTYPVGTVVMAYLYQLYWWGFGNGFGQVGITHNRICLRTAAGWIYTG